ncbi:hypothetical protein DPEC_G00056590 [Dallia pectoralis]|uniref:Uncharacterized protein n=1 Tax=Dallia pectoralis TaxID=75939 RepID=A0ACC2H6X7_DALPE|nr:hypothetical protein DPEC_G00056590 [Dallia pectoralis]
MFDKKKIIRKLLVTLVTLIIVYRWKKNKRIAAPSASWMNRDTQIYTEGCDGDRLSVIYANVYFPTKATDTINQMETSSSEYSIVNFGQSPVLSNFSHPQSSSQTPPIYSQPTKRQLKH